MTDYQNLGSILSQKRQLLDLTLEDVQNKTGIKASFLKALEQEKFNELPPEVYVQGYLKSISKLYGLELARVARLYKEERGFRPTQTDPAKIQTEINTKAVMTPKSLAGALTLAIFLGALVFLGSQIRALTGAPKLTVDTPKAQEQILADTVTVSGTSEPGTTVTINNQPVSLNNDGTFSQNVRLTLGENEIIVKSLNRFNKSAEVKRRVVVGLPADPKVLGAEKTPGTPK